MVSVLNKILSEKIALTTEVFMDGFASGVHPRFARVYWYSDLRNNTLVIRMAAEQTTTRGSDVPVNFYLEQWVAYREIWYYSHPFNHGRILAEMCVQKLADEMGVPVPAPLPSTP